MDRPTTTVKKGLGPAAGFAVVAGARSDASPRRWASKKVAAPWASATWRASGAQQDHDGLLAEQAGHPPNVRRAIDPGHS